MKVVLFAASAILLSACAGVQSSSTGSTQVAQAGTGNGGTLYCWKREFERTSGNFVCNWQDSVRDACLSNGAVVTLDGSRVASEPRNAGRCENGEWLVAISTK